MEHIFITADGYKLRRETKWTDGDLSFDEINGRPVDDQGNPLDGMFSLPVEPVAAPQSTLTLDQFRASKEWCDDLVAKLKDEVFVIGKAVPTPRGWVYLGCLFIEQVLPNWPEETRRRGGWHLSIGRDEWVSDDLAKLEEILFQWARDEGYAA